MLSRPRKGQWCRGVLFPTTCLQGENTLICFHPPFDNTNRIRPGSGTSQPQARQHGVPSQRQGRHVGDLVQTEVQLQICIIPSPVSTQEPVLLTPYLPGGPRFLSKRESTLEQRLSCSHGTQNKWSLTSGFILHSWNFSPEARWLATVTCHLGGHLTLPRCPE